MLEFTPSELDALQRAFKGQANLDEFHHQVLQLVPNQLYPRIERHILKGPAKKGKKRISISNTLQVRTDDSDISILPVTHPERHTTEKFDTLNCMYIDLDFSFYELFLKTKNNF